MVEWLNGEMVKWWNGGMAEWRNGGMEKLKQCGNKAVQINQSLKIKHQELAKKKRGPT